MKLLFDQNLSFHLVRRLSDRFPGSSHLRFAGLLEADDDIIWAHAAEHEFVIVSKDSDFHDLAVRNGHPPKVVWLRVGNCSTAMVERILRRHCADMLDFAADPLRSILEIRESA